MSPVSRRHVLALAGVSLAGCLGQDRPTDGATETPLSPTSRTPPPTTTETPTTTAEDRDIGPVHGEWPAFEFDAGHTAFAPRGHGPTETPAVGWRAGGFVPQSVPVVIDGRVYVGSYRTGLYALDAATGRRTWHANLGEHVNTPAVVDGTVYATTYDLSGSNALTALDAVDGTVRWSRGEFQRMVEPTYADGTVFLGADEAVHAFDAVSGERLWRTPLEDTTAVFGPPAVDDGTVYVSTGAGTGAVHALAASNGSRRWRATFGNRRIDHPTVAGGTVYVGVERDHSDPYDRPTVFAIDVETGDVRPFCTTEGSRPPAVAVTDDRVIVADETASPPDTPPTTTVEPVDTHTPTPIGEATGSETTRVAEKSARLYGVDPATGDRQWAAEIGGRRSFWLPPAVAGNVVYTATVNGVVTAVDADSGAHLWQTTVGTGDNPIEFGPVPAGGVLFVGGDGGVYALAEP